MYKIKEVYRIISKFSVKYNYSASVTCFLMIMLIKIPTEINKVGAPSDKCYVEIQ